MRRDILATTAAVLALRPGFVASQAATDVPTDPPTSPPTEDPTAAPTQTPTVLVGCPPLWISGNPDGYAPGALVSHPTDAGGDIRMVYECKDAPYNLYCPQSGFEPGSVPHGSHAWNELGKCNSAVEFVAPTYLPTSSPSLTPTFPLWEKGGCPEAYDESRGTAYATGDEVEREGLVYQCKTDNGRCRQSGWEPGTGGYWEEAWDLLGSCDGTIVPTSSPTSEALELWEKEGCPKAYAVNTKYEEGETVSNEGAVFECKEWPYKDLCGMPGYAPGVDIPNFEAAWIPKGGCNGTIVPTSTPTYMPSSIPTSEPTYDEWEKGGCPEEFDASLQTRYDELDEVSRDGVVYQCGVWPHSARCNQAGYEPGTGVQWKAAWDVLGSCNGTIVPTMSPTRAALPVWEKTGCPDEYSQSTSYVEGDTVSAYESHVFECKVWPAAGFCNMFSPEDEEYGDLGWEAVGGCEGTLSPTDAPSVDVLSDLSNCAITAYDISTSYEAGDQVSADGNVYECKELPFALWCNNPGYMPGTTNSDMAWNLVGPC